MRISVYRGSFTEAILDQRNLRESFRLGIIIPSLELVKLRWGRSQPWPPQRGRIFFKEMWTDYSGKYATRATPSKGKVDRI